MKNYHLDGKFLRNLLFSTSAPHPGNSEYYLLSEIYSKYGSISSLPETVKLSNSYNQKTVRKLFFKLGFKVTCYSRMYGKTQVTICRI